MKEGELYLSKYKILKVYKETLESCVLLAEHVQLNSYWIIKQLNGVTDETFREVEVLKGVKDTSIPMIIDVILEEDSLTIIREFVEGENLNEYAKDGLSSEEILSIGLKLCRVLRVLHEDLSSPLIFRDIKPGNIIMSKNGDLKLIDFGIARFYKEDTNRDTSYLGTKGFAAPEQYIGKFQSDVRTDVFGLGATLYCLFTGMDLGKPPYKIKAISKYRKDISKSFEKIIIKACEINKENRYQSIKAIENDLKKLIKKEDTISWQDRIKKFDKFTIGISGIKPGGGVSYLSLRMAKYLVNHDLQVAVIDTSINRSLESLEFQDNGILVNKLVNFGGITIINSADLMKRSNTSIIERLKQVDYIIIDIHTSLSGISHQRIKDTLSDIQNFKEVVVSRVSPWEIEAFEEYILSDKYNEEQYLVLNSCTKAKYLAISHSLDDLDCYYLPHKAYEDLTREDLVCKQLFEGMGGDLHWQKKESFLNPKIFKTRLQNKIKS